VCMCVRQCVCVCVLVCMHYKDCELVRLLDWLL
jgi:hypothetical protein